MIKKEENKEVNEELVNINEELIEEAYQKVIENLIEIENISKTILTKSFKQKCIKEALKAAESIHNKS